MMRRGKAPSYKGDPTTAVFFIKYPLLSSLHSFTPLRATSSIGTMFGKATPLIAITLALFASAVPTDVGAGISIPLRKRGSLIRSDGSFDHPKAVLATRKLKHKFRRDVSDLVTYGGPDRGGARMPENPPATANSKRQSESLTDINNDLAWAGDITIGSNNQMFFVDFDSELSSLLPFPSASLRSSVVSNIDRITIFPSRFR
jgi:cathepsin D